MAVLIRMLYRFFFFPLIVAQEIWIFLNKGGNLKKEQLHLKPVCFVTGDSRDALPEFSNTTKRKWIRR